VGNKKDFATYETFVSEAPAYWHADGIKLNKVNGQWAYKSDHAVGAFTHIW